MLCVTGNEGTPEELAERLERVSRRLAGRNHLQEVRLDGLREPSTDVLPLLAPYASRLIVTCRPERQGGAFRGTETERFDVLHGAAALGPAWVDVEADVPEETTGALRRAAPGRVMVSWHVFGGDEAGVADAVRRLTRLEADRYKLAVAVDDATELAPLLELSRGHPDLFVIGMGEAGLLSRCRYPCFGARWTYVSGAPDRETAPGQLTLDQAEEMGLPEAAKKDFLCLVGGDQIRHSPGPRTYNRLFRSRGRPWSYVPVVSVRGREALHLVRELGAMGVSVTMPNKASALEAAEADDEARALGAANTVRFREHGAVATNTDVEGILIPLKQALESLDLGHEPAVLILGAGGAARAAVAACRHLGLEVGVSARRATAAVEAAGVGSAVAWDERGETGHEVLINATPVGGHSDPWPSDRPLGKALVFDLALTGESSSLLERARAEGAHTIPPLEMWLAQGAAQIRFLTGEPVNADQLREVAS